MADWRTDLMKSVKSGSGLASIALPLIGPTFALGGGAPVAPAVGKDDGKGDDAKPVDPAEAARAAFGASRHQIGFSGPAATQQALAAAIMQDTASSWQAIHQGWSASQTPASRLSQGAGPTPIGDISITPPTRFPWMPRTADEQLSLLLRTFEELQSVTAFQNRRDGYAPTSPINAGTIPLGPGTGILFNWDSVTEGVKQSFYDIIKWYRDCVSAIQQKLKQAFLECSEMSFDAYTLRECMKAAIAANNLEILKKCLIPAQAKWNARAGEHGVPAWEGEDLDKLPKIPGSPYEYHDPGPDPWALALLFIALLLIGIAFLRMPPQKAFKIAWAVVMGAGMTPHNGSVMDPYRKDTEGVGGEPDPEATGMSGGWKDVPDPTSPTGKKRVGE